MKKINVIAFFLLSLQMISCQNKIYLKEEQKNWNPYSVGQILIFESSTGRNDSIFIIDVADGIFPDAPMQLDLYNESMTITVKHLDPNYDRYLHNSFIQILAGNQENEGKIDFELMTRNAVFWSKAYTFKELYELPSISLEIPYDNLDDVIVITDNFRPADKSDAIELIYWSKSKGYVKFDKYDGTTWELVEIIEP